MELLTIAETAQFLKLSVNRVYYLVKEGYIPSFKISGSIRVVKEDLEEMIKGGDYHDSE